MLKCIINTIGGWHVPILEFKCRRHLCTQKYCKVINYIFT